MNVQEYVMISSNSRFWLCPESVKEPSLSVNPLLQGLECTRGTVPEPLKDKEVYKTFVESKFDCIIWVNDGKVPFLAAQDTEIERSDESSE